MSSGWGGLAAAVGRLGEQRRERSDSDLRSQTAPILEDVKRLQDRRASLPEGDPGIKEIDDSLAEHQRVFTELLRHNKVSPDQISGLLSSAAGTAPKDPYLTPDELKKKARIAAGLDPRAVEPKPEGEDWKFMDVTFPDQTTRTVKYNQKYQGKLFDLAGGVIPPEQLQGARQAPKPSAGGHSKFNEQAAVYAKAWGVPIEKWSPEQLKFFNQEMAYEAQRSGSSTTTRLVIDQNNQVIPVEVPSTRSPGAPPREDPSWRSGGASIPKTPGEAKQRAAATRPKAGGGGVHVGTPLPITAKNSVEQAAHKDYITAYKLSEAADLVANEPNNAQSQKSLAVALERAAAGRFTTQALDYINKAGWTAGAEQFWNNIDNGTLPEVVMKNLIQRAHDNKQSSYDAWQESRKPSVDASATTPPTTTPQKELTYNPATGKLE